MFCSSCYQLVPEVSRVCGNCGRVLAEGHTRQRPLTNEERTRVHADLIATARRRRLVGV